MRLVELAPRWVALDGNACAGVSFLCPHCREARRVVFFHDAPVPGPRWARAGDSFENMTLAPSLDFSVHGHWHGRIVQGAAISA